MTRRYVLTHFEGRDEMDVTTTMFPVNNASRRHAMADEIFGTNASLDLLFLPGHPDSGKPEFRLKRLVDGESTTRRGCVVLASLAWIGCVNYGLPLCMLSSAFGTLRVRLVCSLVTATASIFYWLFSYIKLERINRNITEMNPAKDSLVL